ncbi:type III-A CRISPR-associated RAMP protein Csm3 [Deferribacteraceae bacterium V6Fe1]|nr:type III-A CRISPR-associated RAMP protein Csm3 [Deferribacteraceae bacterium V6Fe1]
MNIKNITGKIILESGLHIGAGDSEMHIGGVDNPVIKDAISGRPYIPGSSIKGKIRSLLEYYMNIHMKYNTKGQPLQAKHLEDESKKIEENDKDIIKLFGTSGSDSNKHEFGITRTIFSDAHINEASVKSLELKTGQLTEIKAETAIDRVKGTALNGSLRFIERVPRGAEFNFSVSLKTFPNDDFDSLKSTLLKGFKLLTLDALGGSGSRGYGRVSIKFDDENLQKEFEDTKL